ncbi:uncharacterized protein MONBRDRAFT_16379, partial [Monosiga brevicollis MX1]
DYARRIADLFAQAAKAQCRMLFLPEAFDWIGLPVEETKSRAVPTTHAALTRYWDLCKQHSIWASFGGAHVQTDDPQKRIANRHVIVDPLGQVRSTYDKIHLFDVDTADGVFKESDFTQPGRTLVTVPDTPLGTLGLSICYDVRFPEVYTELRARGADVLLVPSAFMPSTGKAHWEALLRARAIETQCFVIAAAQAGTHAPSTRRSYGHSLVVDPWGDVLVDGDAENEGLLAVTIDLERITEVRTKMPLANHRQAVPRHLFTTQQGLAQDP